MCAAITSLGHDRSGPNAVCVPIASLRYHLLRIRKPKTFKKYTTGIGRYFWFVYTVHRAIPDSRLFRSTLISYPLAFIYTLPVHNTRGTRDVPRICQSPKSNKPGVDEVCTSLTTVKPRVAVGGDGKRTECFGKQTN